MSGHRSRCRPADLLGGQQLPVECQSAADRGRIAEARSQFASSLDDAIQNAADNAGLGDDYRGAVNEYRSAMKLNDAWETTKELGKAMVTKTIQNAPWIGGAYAVARKYMP